MLLKVHVCSLLVWLRFYHLNHSIDGFEDGYHHVIERRELITNKTFKYGAVNISTATWFCGRANAPVLFIHASSTRLIIISPSTIEMDILSCAFIPYELISTNGILIVYPRVPFCNFRVPNSMGVDSIFLYYLEYI